MTGRPAEIVKAFGAVQSEMRRGLGSLDVGAFSETKAARVKRDLVSAIDALAVFAARWAVKAVKVRYQDEQGKVRNRLEMIGAKRNRAFDKRRHTHAMERSSDAILKDYMKATASMKMLVGQYIEGLRRHSTSLMQVQEFDASGLGPLADEYIGALVTDAIANNKARGWVSSQIMDWLRKNLADGNYITIGTRRFEVRAYSEMVARTRMIEASTEAVKEMCKEYESDLVEIPMHEDACEKICRPYQGEVYSLSGNDPEFELLPDGGPPWHPNCECSANPTSRIALSWRGRNN